MYHINQLEYLKIKSITIDKEGQFIIIESSITFINEYGPNDINSKYMRQKLTELKGEIVQCIIIVTG